MADDTFKKTPDDQFVSTDADKWIIDCTVTPSKLDLAWAAQAPVPLVSISVVKQDIAYALETPVQSVVNLPAKQDITYTLNAVTTTGVLLYLASKQDLTWTVNAPTVTLTLDKTVSPAVQNLSWLVKGISISSGDYFVDTAADKWVSGADRWAFKAGGAIDTYIQVDKQSLTWSVNAPVVSFGRTVYLYDHLTDEDGNAIFDEAGNPIPLEGAMDDVTLTWTVNAPTIGKSPELIYTPADFNLTWSLNAPTAVPTVVPDALQLSYTLSDGTVGVAVFPAKSDLTWTVNAPTILGDTMPKPDALALVWTLKAPRIGGTGLGKRRRKGLLLGVYQG